MAIALDPAASEFYSDATYHVAGERLSSSDMIERYAEMTDRFPVWSIEDGLAESDWDRWERPAARLGGTTSRFSPAFLRKSSRRPARSWPRRRPQDA